MVLARSSIVSTRMGRVDISLKEHYIDTDTYVSTRMGRVDINIKIRKGAVNIVKKNMILSKNL